MAKKQGIVLGADHLEQVARGRQVAPGDGHNSRGIESVLAPRQANREGLPPMPANPGARIDSPMPAPTTTHVKSNTVRSETFANGVYPGSLNDNASARPTTPTMEQSLEPQSRASTKDSPVPLGTQHPDLADRGKPDEIAHADPDMGLGEQFPGSGVMDR